ncbi:TetR family transcriptional regulator [Paenibacillus selenitireducens]|uniref:TetR family transcriptional regulator n=1 Tax=Paenibacillus selenitireducens TaxID=1324314 RepID=A0A1T2XHH0_9BACL|nr:TetR/AcrR family transcriptional regulator [Paenibacillus selenitireducens]OPA79113.1 TetR family transcriptional regulator [Paenibacillus selenitireducens]
MSTTSPRTDRRVLRTRQLIRDAFIDLLQEIELEKITVNRIAERATINRVTFYLHYRDVPDMIEKMADDMINEIHAVLNDIRSQPHPTDMDWSILVKILEHIAENSKFYKVLLASQRIPVFTDRLMKLIIDIITSRSENRDDSSPSSAVIVPKDIAIWYGSSAFIGTIVCWLRNDMPYTPLFLAKQLSLLFRLHQNTNQLVDPE